MLLSTRRSCCIAPGQLATVGESRDASVCGQSGLSLMPSNLSVERPTRGGVGAPCEQEQIKDGIVDLQ
ncbi:MAG: hypothetical protein JWM12_4326 [Ilumatobacteraceae bacterium]|nr:hypothetical protein [Ilumatobacteraceae bacterium]